ncbi:hypothetical protein DOK67_0002878 [Enterococcus sp. DIV0212c]|uniref:EutN/CcmL family microcompartment protein n=1 Tax=Candidatus Enterococcus ikei TaxID=2815326 RepID=A0ABS3GW17_9ENTE|nr:MULTISPECIES: EutN/CcmL family microcompartment protein [unclassified Enterococcus]MBO0439375.1 EutN/CcmL family microcompartment protein [Enterococcus sp. DIV0869a]
MILGKVIGRIISNQKSPELTGAKLLIVQKIDQHMTLKEDLYVAIDKVGAGVEDIVLLGEYSTSERCETFQDNMAIVAIVEQLQIQP